MKSPIADLQYTGGAWKDGGFQRNFESRKNTTFFCTDYAISILAFVHVLKFNWCVGKTKCLVSEQQLNLLTR